ncbi:MAG: efflux RND transporter periplasmic adaptor subunit [Vulcanibacillus sp.]
MKSQLEKNKKRGKSKLIVSLAIIVLLATAGLAYYVFFTPEEVEEITYQTGQVKQGDLTLSIENSGVIKYSDQYTLTSTVNGTINRLYVDENSNVEVNETILSVDDRNLYIQLEQAYANLKISQLSLANLLQTSVDNIYSVSVNQLSTVVAPIDGVVSYNVQEGTNINNGNSVMTLTNYEELNFIAQIPAVDVGYIKLGEEIVISVDRYSESQTGIVTKISEDSYSNGSEMVNDVYITISNPGLLAGMTGEAGYRTDTILFKYAKGTFFNAEESSVYSKISGTIDEIYVEYGQYVTKGTQLFKIDDTSLENQIETQKQNIYNNQLKIDSLKLELENTTVTSPKTGVISELFVEENQTIGSSTKIATLTSDSLVASIEVDEMDISKVVIGQEATLLIPGYSEVEEIIGVVSFIADTGIVKDGITTYEVQISFENNPKIKEGMTVDVAIILEKAENVFKVPTSSIISVKDGKAVRVLVGEEIVAKKVETGISDDTMTEIISGLEANETIITSVTYPAGTSSTSSSSSLIPTSVKIPGVTGGGTSGGQ